MVKSYSDKLQDRRWQKRRLEELERAQWVCEWCNCDDKTTLYVHHWVYVKDPWQAPKGTLTVLCKPCHGKADRLRLAASKLLALTLANPEVETDNETIDDFVSRFENAAASQDTSEFLNSILWWFDGGGFWRDRWEEVELFAELGVAAAKLSKLRKQSPGRSYGIVFRNLAGED